MYGVYPVRHCDQYALLSIVNESSLSSRRQVAFLIFFQKPLCGKIISNRLFNEVKICIPKLCIRQKILFIKF